MVKNSAWKWFYGLRHSRTGRCSEAQALDILAKAIRENSELTPEDQEVLLRADKVLTIVERKPWVGGVGPRRNAHPASIGQLRQAFLEAAAVLVPSVLSDLRRDVLPVFQSCGAELLEADAFPDRLKTTTAKAEHVLDLAWGDLAGADLNSFPPIGQMRASLLGWARVYSVEHCSWLLATAVGTVLEWLRFEDLGEAERWAPQPGDGVDADAITFRTTPWHRLLESRDSFENRVKEEFARWIRRYTASVITEHRGYGPSRRSPDHLIWLAWYQFARLSPQRICRQYKNEFHREVEPDSVRKGIDSAAQLINLPMREGRRGRERGASR